MKIIARTLNDVTILELEGQLALEGSAAFRKQASTAIDAGARKLIVDLAGVDYMDSMGLGELISCHTVLSRMDGSLKLLHLSRRLYHLLVITKLHTVLETFDSESAAIASFTQPVKTDAAVSDNAAH